MIQMKAIASGSNGNCIFVSDGQTNILIDCGISCKRIVSAVSELVGSPEAISAILLTHEHSDHT